MNPLTLTSITNIIGFLAVFMTLNALLLYLFPRPEIAIALPMGRKKRKQRRQHQTPA